MAYKFLYIDDIKDKIEQGTINGLQDKGEISIQFRFPDDWEKQISELLIELPKVDGVLLDLRLNDTPYAEGKSAAYRGSTIAQEIRTLIKENVLKEDFPIVLISATDKLEKSLDQTSKDLFDWVLSKNEIGSSISFDQIVTKLKWLADGYKFINKSPRTVEGILVLPADVILDTRFVDRFTILKDKAVHVIAGFIVREIVQRPSFLINEFYLATRLGVDIKSEGWPELRDKVLEKYKYQGAFSNFYPRWWMFLVDKFWKETISEEFTLRNTSSSKKIQLLNEKTGIKGLTAIQRAPISSSDSFWVVCKATGTPIDTIDGFLIGGQDDNYSWQEAEYVSIAEALRPTKYFNISPIEKPRLQKIKEAVEKHEQANRK